MPQQVDNANHNKNFLNIIIGTCDILDYYNIIIRLKKKFNENGRFTPKTKKDLVNAIECFMKDKKSSLNIFGDMNTWDVSKITDMSCLFQWQTNFNEDISNWDVSNVTNMKEMFYKCKNFNKDISKWDVSNVTNMEGMFKWCEKFNQSLNKWNVSKVTNMSCMFHMCRNFNKTIDNWKVSSLEYYNCMFSGCKYYEPRYNRPEWYNNIKFKNL